MGKFYRVVVRPTTFYEAECWPIKKSRVQKKKIVQMRILMWVCGHTKSGKIKNGDIRHKVGVASMLDKMREVKLR